MILLIIRFRKNWCVEASLSRFLYGSGLAAIRRRTGLDPGISAPALVQTDDFNQSADLFVLTGRDPQGVILYHDAYLYRVCTAGKSYQGQPLLIIYKQSIDGQTLKLKESVYYRSEQDVDAWMDNLAMIRGQVVEYPY